MIRGERFEFDLGLDNENDRQTQTNAPPPGAFVGDIREREPAAPKTPTAPTLKSKTGFPEHKKRESRFKQQKVSSPQLPNTAPNRLLQPPQPVQSRATDLSISDGGESRSWEAIEKQGIDEENRQKLARMTPAEIEQEREELMGRLCPAFLQRLLKRSNISSGGTELDLSAPQRGPVRSVDNKKPSTKSVSFADPSTTSAPDTEPVFKSAAGAMGIADDSTEAEIRAPDIPTQGTIHFPRAPQPPDLDPNSDTFLEDLHDKYFPSLPSDPDKLEWMQPSTSSGYDSASRFFHGSSIRFDFKGQLLAPKTAAAIPTTEGLHHHGDAPEAAGYTIAELAHLARSTYPAQRCIASQTLGRLLYRLGKGEFGDPGEADFSGSGIEGTDREDSFGELARGLWHEVEKENAIETLVIESEGMGVDRGRHLSAKNYAIEAVWLWRKGGGRRWKAG